MKNILLKLYICIFVLTGAAFAASIPSAIDPSYIGIGARPMGLGKAFTGVAENGESIFVNSAGLGQYRAPKYISMYSDFMGGDVKYTVLGGTIPLEIGSMGLGYINTRTDGIIVANSSGAITGSGASGNSVAYVSYGAPLSAVYESAQNIYVGASLKYFSQTASGTSSASGANGSGLDVDLGALYIASPMVTLGLNISNALPAGIGSMSFAKGSAESISSTAKFGAKINLLGEKEKAFLESTGKVNLSLDTDIYEDGRPYGLHLGAEFWPIEQVALRVGYDKDTAPTTASQSEYTNMTYGVGVRMGEFAFDYAYHPFAGIADDTSHFFSVSYVGPEQEVQKQAAADYITVIRPKDKTVTRKDTVRASGFVKQDVDRLEINGVPVNLIRDGGKVSFSTKITLDNSGKRLIIFEAFDSDGQTLMKKKVRILKMASFTDVDEDYWAVEPIEFMATAGMVEGYPDGTFQPNRVLSRAELAAILVRTKGEDIRKTIEKSIFPDLPNYHWAARYIEAANQLGLVIGYPDKTFRPNRTINRVEGVMVGTRFDGNIGEKPLSDPYKDIKIKHWASANVEIAKEKGMLDYIASDRFQPKEGLTRSEAMEILSKTDMAKEKIDWLLDWNRGFSSKSIKKKVVRSEE